MSMNTKGIEKLIATARNNETASALGRLDKTENKFYSLKPKEMEELTKNIVELCEAIIKDSAATTKSAHARIRKNTLALEKLGKQYRKASIEADK